MRHQLTIARKYERLILDGRKRKEFRLRTRRYANVSRGDELAMGGLICCVRGVREYPNIDHIPAREADNSGFASLAELQQALHRIYWYPGADHKPILVWDVQVLSPPPQEKLPIPDS